jgi:hypothetical protein
LKKAPYNKKIGWSHSVICNLARDYGLISYRRLWSLAERDREFLKAEGATSLDLEAYEQEVFEEGIFALQKAIDEETPLIISIHKDFDNKNDGHLVVLVGYYATDEGILGFYVNDPIGAQYKHKNQFIEYKDFIDGWKKRAIYVKKASRNGKIQSKKN